MAKFQILLYRSNQRKDGSYPVCLRIAKQNKTKYIYLGLSAKEKQWSEETARFKKDKRVNPNHEKFNALLNHYEERKDDLLRRFAEKRTNWTINQFEEEFLGASKKGKIYDYWVKQIEILKVTNHNGNARAYKAGLHILEKYDKKIRERLFSEINIKYVNALNAALEKDNCCGNTRKGYLKTLRAVLNRAIMEKEASAENYPFGNGGFAINKLEEETSKRYLTNDDLLLIKNCSQDSPTMEYTRKLFLFSYYCFGMNFVDMASLTSRNIEKSEFGYHIVYKRQKIKNQKTVKTIKIIITDEIREILDWFKNNTVLTGDYLIPVITKDYSGEQLYTHIRSRYVRYAKNLKKLGETLGFKRRLTSYVGRHTVAMILQNQNVPREQISQALGHNNLTTTNVYLDSFGTDIMDKVAQLL